MKILSAITAIIATRYQMDAAGVEEFVGGLIFGLIKKDDLPEIQKCLKDSENLEVQIVNALADVSKGDLQDILKGVQEIGQILQELPVDLSDCQGMSGDIAKIENWASIFSHPTTLITTLTKNLLSNWKDVVAEVSQTSSDYSSADYYKVGEDVGDLLILSVGPISKASNVTMESVDWSALQNNLGGLY
uniref:Uncharacterized protein n=1 Tax=Strombidium rassoulzadegani TaxID=1082188 RepID=A0A7S3CQ13_9SPIT